MISWVCVLSPIAVSKLFPEGVTKFIDHKTTLKTNSLDRSSNMHPSFHPSMHSCTQNTFNPKTPKPSTALHHPLFYATIQHSSSGTTLFQVSSSPNDSQHTVSFALGPLNFLQVVLTCRPCGHGRTFITTPFPHPPLHNFISILPPQIFLNATAMGEASEDQRRE